MVQVVHIFVFNLNPSKSPPSPFAPLFGLNFHPYTYYFLCRECNIPMGNNTASIQRFYVVITLKTSGCCFKVDIAVFLLRIIYLTSQLLMKGTVDRMVKSISSVHNPNTTDMDSSPDPHLKYNGFLIPSHARDFNSPIWIAVNICSTIKSCSHHICVCEKLPKFTTNNKN